MCKASIRSHLLLLVLAVSVPLVAIVGLGIYADTQQTINQTKNSLRMLASTMVSNTGGKIANARQIIARRWRNRAAEWSITGQRRRFRPS